MGKKLKNQGKAFLLATLFLQTAAIISQIYLINDYKPLAPFWGYSLRPACFTWSNDERYLYALIIIVILSSHLAVLALVVNEYKNCKLALWMAGGIILLLLFPIYITHLFIYIPSSIKYVIMALSFAQLAVTVLLLCAPKADNPRLPLLLIFLPTVPNIIQGYYIYYSWNILYGIVLFSIPVWLFLKLMPISGKLQKILYASAVCCGITLAWWNFTTPKKVSYGYHIGFAEIQFGNINGDKYPDLFTCGYIGMGYGNPTWFIGRKDHFDDWENNQYLTSHIGQETACLVDLDNDGDMDILGTTTLINEGGCFKKEIDCTRCLMSICFARERRFTIKAAALTPGDTFSELILDDGYNAIIGICRKAYDWKFFEFNSPLWSVIDNSVPDKPVLIILNTPSTDLIKFIKKEKINFKIIKLDLKEKIWPPVFLYKDINSDGKQELLVWTQAKADNPDNTASKIFICKKTEDHFEVISSFRTGSYRQNLYCGYYAYPEYKFADFDQDGKIDFLGDDGWIYRQKNNFRFEKDKKICLRKSKEAIHLYACDINDDGFPDVISSYQPFTNIIMGPL